MYYFWHAILFRSSGIFLRNMLDAQMIHNRALLKVLMLLQSHPKICGLAYFEQKTYILRLKFILLSLLCNPIFIAACFTTLKRYQKLKKKKYPSFPDCPNDPNGSKTKKIWFKLSWGDLCCIYSLTWWVSRNSTKSTI